MLLLLDRNLNEERHFVTIETESGARITLTASHLIYLVSKQDFMEDIDLNEIDADDDDDDASDARQEDDLNHLNATMDLFKSRLHATFAYKAQIGDWIVVVDGVTSPTPRPERVTGVGVTFKTGVVAPLTDQGTLVVDGVLVSCYAVIDDQSIAHGAFAPVRVVHNVGVGLAHFWSAFSKSLHWWTIATPAAKRRDAPINAQLDGIHWYAKLLYRIAKYVLPSHLVYN